VEHAPTIGASSGESAAPIAPGKRDVANCGLQTPASYRTPSQNMQLQIAAAT